MKYTNYEVTFAEVPDEISLCINISNCPCNCTGCHSSYLSKDIGEELSIDKLHELIKNNKGITCICFMGGDNDPKTINNLAFSVKLTTSLKTAWYSGRQYIPDEIDVNNFDFIKIGPYIEKLGGLSSMITNQIMYKIQNGRLYDITYKFWKNVIKGSI